jgi:Zn-dependent alcohol dehydrogenase
MTAVGICHTDVFTSSIPNGAMPGATAYPKILGHEGAGTVISVGSAVDIAKPGDYVLLSYDYCGECVNCKLGKGQSCNCDQFLPKNTYSVEGTFRSQSNNKESVPTAGKFFGQSSFASYSLVEDKSIVNVTHLLKNPAEELKLLAPLGCGLMTGTGAMCNVAKITPESIVLVLGAGAVGMGAVMAARNLGAKGIIVVDKVAHRLATAKELGATETLDTTGMEMAAIPQAIMGLAANISGGNPMSINYCFETTGHPGVTGAGMNALAPFGLLIAVGIPPLHGKYEFSAMDMYFMRKTYEVNMLGNSESRVILPLMIKWWRDGKFPLEKLVKYYDAKDVLKALDGMESGACIKPVLVW